MPPKTTWGNPELFIENDMGGMDALGVLETLPITDEPGPIQFAKAFSRLNVTVKLSEVSFEVLCRVLGWRLPTIRFRTGIKPKRNRTRRKQRFTRLRRRTKRQNKKRRKA